MNWIDFIVSFFVALALLAVLFYKLYPIIFKKKHRSRKSREMIRFYKKAKKKELKKKQEEEIKRLK